jgi:very-short-patch-repair endonuclease
MRSDQKTFARALRRNMTDAEEALWNRLRDPRSLGLKFRRQHPFAGFVLDFFCARSAVAVELDGGQHADSTSDRRRDAILLRRGVLVLRYWNDDVLRRPDEVITDIVNRCVARGARSSFSRAAGEGAEGG